MVGFRHYSDGQTDEPRLETPRHAGYRSGTSATRMIGNRLARVYEVTADLPGDIGEMLRDLDRKASGSR